MLIDYASGRLTGDAVQRSVKTLGAMSCAFGDQGALTSCDPNTVLYRVEYWLPVQEGQDGGLFIGTTVIEPGRVGDEYFMTHGHFHAKRDRAEFYVTLSGTGGLILMDEQRATRWEAMSPGSVHYIHGRVAHRVANTGGEPLAFLGCWPSDAGHDYDTIRTSDFSARLRDVNGRPELVGV
jgi:glucose-6-phosphate isomerase